MCFAILIGLNSEKSTCLFQVVGGQQLVYMIPNTCRLMEQLSFGALVALNIEKNVVFFMIFTKTMYFQLFDNKMHIYVI